MQKATRSLLLVLLLSTSLLADETVTVYYNKYSWYQPWKSPDSYSTRVQAVQVGNLFFTVIEPGAYPSFIQTDYSSRIKIRTYDPQTGFLSYAHSRKTAARPVCTEKPDLVIMETGNTMVPVSGSAREQSGKNEIIVKNGKFCGYRLWDVTIPPSTISWFLKNSSRHGNAFLHPGFDFRNRLSPSEEQYYLNGQAGFVIREVLPNGPSHKLFPGDAVTSVNGQRIIHTDTRETILNKLMIRGNSPVTEITLEILRDGRKKTISYNPRPCSENSLVSSGTTPQYLISAGIVFTELSGEFIAANDAEGVPNAKFHFLRNYYSRSAHPYKKSIVVLSRVLPHLENEGYHSLENLVLQKVNSTEITSLYHLKKVLGESKSEYIRFEFDGGKEIIFKKEKMEKITNDIVTLFSIGQADNIIFPEK